MILIDLQKSYDSVPREALWHVLQKYGIPQSMINVIRSLHDGMQAEVTVDGQVAPKFEVCNGLRLCCVIAPTLFKTFTLGWSLSSGGRSVVNLEWMSFISVCGREGGGGVAKGKEAIPNQSDRALCLLVCR